MQRSSACKACMTASAHAWKRPRRKPELHQRTCQEWYPDGQPYPTCMQMVQKEDVEGLAQVLGIPAHVQLEALKVTRTLAAVKDQAVADSHCILAPEAAGK